MTRLFFTILLAIFTAVPLASAQTNIEEPPNAVTVLEDNGAKTERVKVEMTLREKLLARLRDEHRNGKLALQAILKDYWERLNAASYDELQAAIDTNGTTWTEKTGEGDRYTITTSFSDTGKYVNATCYAGEPGTDDRKCRKVSIQINDSLNGLTQAVNLTKADAAAGGSALESRLAALENNFNSFKTSTDSKFSSTNAKFGDYYQKSEVNSKLGDFTCTAGREYDGSRCLCPGYSIFNQSSQSCQECPANHRTNSAHTTCVDCGYGYYPAQGSCRRDPTMRIEELSYTKFCNDVGQPHNGNKGDCCGIKAKLYLDGQVYGEFTINGVSNSTYGGWYSSSDTDFRCTIGGKTLYLAKTTKTNIILKPSPESPACLAPFTVTATYRINSSGVLINEDGNAISGPQDVSYSFRVKDIVDACLKEH